MRGRHGAGNACSLADSSAVSGIIRPSSSLLKSLNAMNSRKDLILSMRTPCSAPGGIRKGLPLMFLWQR